MTTKQWLMRARRLEERLAALRLAKARAYDRATAATARLNAVGASSSSKSSPNDKNAAYAIVSEEADMQEKTLVNMRAQILQACGEVQDNTLSTLLIEYYVNGKTWEQVAVAINYSYSQVVKYLHPRALRAIQDAIVCHNDP